ncbi:Uncharacterised protein [Brevibacterium casei]|uniref:GATA-type domain-containing protein n=1 Tax=Brevibacterium casei TaxID=33889 RepID=A0A449CYK8_9MICO|nr:Uncharacterised protein [Brevibacterium casei]
MIRRLKGIEPDDFGFPQPVTGYWCSTCSTPLWRTDGGGTGQCPWCEDHNAEFAAFDARQAALRNHPTRQEM